MPPRGSHLFEYKVSNQLPIHYPFGIHYPGKWYSPNGWSRHGQRRVAESVHGSLSHIRDWLDMGDLPLIAEAYYNARSQMRAHRRPFRRKRFERIALSDTSKPL